MHHPIQIGDLSVTFLKSRHETSGHLDLFEMTVPSHAQLNVAHLHRDYDETIIGMDGVVTWTLNGRQVQLARGEQLYIPRGVAHSYMNRHRPTARMMCILTPGLLGPEYFREIAAAVNVEGPPNLAGITSVMARYGVIPAYA